ncbi:MAG: glycosyltransferase family 39 protein [Candidatus Sulfotelmatobacter sp.]
MVSSKTAVGRDTVDSLQNSSSPTVWRRVSLFTLALLATAAAVLRFLFLTRKPFWFDECFSAEVSRLNCGDFWRLMWWREANMSLYYVLLRGWLHFGFNPFFIRSFSVALSLLALPAIYWLGCELFDRRVALIAVALLSFNAYHIRYAQEARGYSLLVLLTMLSSGFFVAMLRKPSRPNRLCYGLASVLAVYAHLYALLLVAAQWVSVRGWRRNQKPHMRDFGSQASTSAVLLRDSMPRSWLRKTWGWIGIAVLPLLVFAAKTGAGPIRWITRPGLRDMLEFAEHMAGNAGLPLLLLYVAACMAAIVPQGKMTWLFRPVASDLWVQQFLLIWLLFPIVLTLLLSSARPIFLGRYFIFCLPPLVILAAAGLARLRSTWLLALGLAAMLLLSMQGTLRYYDHDFDLERDGSGAATDYILTHARPGDAILFYIPGARSPYEFFRSIRTVSGSQTGAVAGPEIIYPHHGDGLRYRDFTGKLGADFMRSVPGGYARVWLVLMDNELAGHPDATTLMINEILGEVFPLVEREQFPQVEVRLYSKP